MKFRVEADCTPAEARAFLGLPDLAPLNAHIVDEMKQRLDANIALLQPDEVLKAWTSFGGMAQDQFMKLMSAAATAGFPNGKPRG